MGSCSNNAILDAYEYCEQHNLFGKHVKWPYDPCNSEVAHVQPESVPLGAGGATVSPAGRTIRFSDGNWHYLRGPVPEGAQEIKGLFVPSPKSAHSTFVVLAHSEGEENS